MSQLKLQEAVTGIEIGSKLRVKQRLSDTGRLYANTTIKSTRNRLLLICWKPQLSSPEQSPQQRMWGLRERLLSILQTASDSCLDRRHLLQTPAGAHGQPRCRFIAQQPHWPIPVPGLVTCKYLRNTAA